MLEVVSRPFGMLLMWLYELVGGYGWAIILFALVVKLILLPFQMKSKVSMMRVSRLTPKMKELEKRHEGNPRKYQEEVAKLYREEGASPMGGCLWTIIPLPFMLALYQAIRFPITVMMGVPRALMSAPKEGASGAVVQLLERLGFESSVSNAYIQISQSQFIADPAHFDQFTALSDNFVALNYNFLGLNLGEVPEWNFFTKVDWSVTESWFPALGLFLIPIVSAALTVLSTKLSQAMNPASGATGNAAKTPQAQQMKSMMLFMPLMSLYICFIMPAALGVYWIASSVFSIIQEFILNKTYKKRLDAEDAERRERDRERQAEIERRHQETERLKAEGKTDRNGSTSKKKLQAQQKAEHDAIKAAAAREERQRRREHLGIGEEDVPEAQVGSRRYARGRAFVDDRFENPDEAEEKSAKAAAESEFGEAIDERVELEVVSAEAEDEAYGEFDGFSDSEEFEDE